MFTETVLLPLPCGEKPLSTLVYVKIALTQSKSLIYIVHITHIWFVLFFSILYLTSHVLNALNDKLNIMVCVTIELKQAEIIHYLRGIATEYMESGEGTDENP